MSANKNIESMAHQGEFSSRVPPSEPLTTGGHKPGVKVGNDAAPEFNAEIHQAGTAPRETTHLPNPTTEIPPTGGTTSALDSLPGATSATVHNDTQFGKPIGGQTSQEHHGVEKKDRTGLGTVTGDGSVEKKVRGLGTDLEGRAGELKGQKGVSGSSEGGLAWQGADERVPASAEEVASEVPSKGHAGVASGERKP